jgi:hypothetical protein
MYEHIQRSHMNVLLYVPAIVAFFVAWLVRENVAPNVAALALAVILLVLSLCLQTLRVSDRGEYLDVRFGPLNLFGTKIAYRDMIKVEPGKTSWIDGWGIHFIPFRGWTLNVWGFRCVKIVRIKGTIRIGTDDSENLVRFLRARLEQISTMAANQNRE